MPTPTPTSPLRIMVLAGGPDRERSVSLKSGRTVADALREAGHDVRLEDIMPDDLSAIDRFNAWHGDVVFPMLHGRWGEGGQLQAILESRQLAFVGTGSEAAHRCMDKELTKQALMQANLPTPAYQVITSPRESTLAAPVVVKPPLEGSSIDLRICLDEVTLAAALTDLTPRHDRLLIEQFVAGKEMTVAVLEGFTRTTQNDSAAAHAMPPIQIVPPGAFYDFHAKYESNDTRYHIGPEATGLSSTTLDELMKLAVKVHQTMGCRHLSRVDFIVDADGCPWVLEINTIPGFTTHSLTPMAANAAGMSLPQLTSALVMAAATSLH